MPSIKGGWALGCSSQQWLLWMAFLTSLVLWQVLLVVGRVWQPLQQLQVGGEHQPQPTSSSSSHQ